MQDTVRSFGLGALAIAVLAAGAGRELAPRIASSPSRAEVVASDVPPPTPAARTAFLEDSVVTGTALLEEFFGDSLAHLDRCVDAARC